MTTEAGEEIEVKFHVQRLALVQQRAEGLGGRLIAPRMHELNLRFDTNDKRLEGQGCALRLRSDAKATLTFKGPSEVLDGIRQRVELELGVDDFAGARQILMALGYVVTFTYEKYRTVYGLGEATLMLDELPYGDFVEIEGEPETIKSSAERLGLRWELAIPDSYLGIFSRLQHTIELAPTELRFDSLAGIPMDLGLIGISAADS
ncbi:MAG TPA: class IV adenylate cyclase [Anaerolineales bacterium]